MIPLPTKLYVRHVPSMKSTPDFLYSLVFWYDLSISQRTILTKYFTAKRYALLGRLEKVGMKNIRILK